MACDSPSLSKKDTLYLALCSKFQITCWMFYLLLLSVLRCSSKVAEAEFWHIWLKLTRAAKLWPAADKCASSESTEETWYSIFKIKSWITDGQFDCSICLSNLRFGFDYNCMTEWTDHFCDVSTESFLSVNWMFLLKNYIQMLFDDLSTVNT